MTKSPIVNAFLALLYIVIISLIFYFGATFKIGKDNYIFAPIAFLSLFTFSAATMGYLFFYQPFVFYFDGKKKQALNLFLQTLMIFGGITFAIFIFLFLISFSKS
jgi:hypothetical protein